VTQFVSVDRVFIPVSDGTKINKIYQELPVENVVEHFHRLRGNEVNFHDVRCLTVMTSSSH